MLMNERTDSTSDSFAQTPISPHASLRELYQADYFDERFAGKDPLREASYNLEFDKLSQFISTGKVLDVGCGMGGFLERFSNSKWDKFGIEISEFAAQRARERGIKIVEFDTQETDFDLIIWRGVFQHLETPLKQLSQCIQRLKPGGFIVFLATPNANSIYYKLWNTLPMLDPKRNFVIPSDVMLEQILENYGLEIRLIDRPYLSSPYAKPIKDHLNFVLRLLGFNRKFAFWGNMMEIIAQKSV